MGIGAPSSDVGIFAGLAFELLGYEMRTKNEYVVGLGIAKFVHITS